MTDHDDTKDDSKPDEKAKKAPRQRLTTSPTFRLGGNLDAETPWHRLFRGQGQEESKVEALIRERFEQLAAQVLERRLGTSIDDEGKPDFSDLTQERLDKSMPDLGVELLTTYLQAIRPLLSDKEEDQAELDESFEGIRLEPQEQQLLRRAAEDIKMVLGLMGKSADEAAGDALRLVERLKSALGENFADIVDALGGSPSRGATPPTLSRDFLQRAVADRLLGLFRQLGEIVAESRVPLGAAPDTPAHQGAEAPGTAGAWSGAGEETGAGAEGDEDDDGGTKADVIVLEEVRRRIEDKQKQLAGLPDIIGKLFAEADTSSKGGTGQNVNLNLDQDFLREHGPTLLKELFEGFSKTLVPKTVELTLPMSPDEKTAAKAAAEATTPVAEGEVAPGQAGGEEGASSGDEPPLKVSVNLDLANLLGGLFRSKEPDSKKS